MEINLTGHNHSRGVPSRDPTRFFPSSHNKLSLSACLRLGVLFYALLVLRDTLSGGFVDRAGKDILGVVVGTAMSLVCGIDTNELRRSSGSCWRGSAGKAGAGGREATNADASRAHNRNGRTREGNFRQQLRFVRSCSNNPAPPQSRISSSDGNGSLESDKVGVEQRWRRERKSFSYCTELVEWFRHKESLTRLWHFPCHCRRTLANNSSSSRCVRYGEWFSAIVGVESQCRIIGLTEILILGVLTLITMLLLFTSLLGEEVEQEEAIMTLNGHRNGSVVHFTTCLVTSATNPSHFKFPLR